MKKQWDARLRGHDAKGIAELIILLITLLFPLTLSAAQPQPQTAEQASILIVDVKRILDESKASVGVQKKIEEQRSAFQTEIAAKEKTIRAAEQELLASRGKIAPSTYAEKENQLRQKFREVEQYVQDRRRLLEQATTLSMGKVRSVLVGIVTEIARKKGAQAVLVRQQVLWSENSADITNQVLERLNAQLPELPLKLDGPKEPVNPKAGN